MFSYIMFQNCQNLCVTRVLLITSSVQLVLCALQKRDLLLLGPISFVDTHCYPIALGYQPVAEWEKEKI